MASAASSRAAVLSGSANTTWLMASATQRYSPLAKSSRARAIARRRAAHVGDRLARALHRRQRIEVGGIGVVQAQVALIDGLRVVAEGAVVAAHVPLLLEALRQRQPLGNLTGLEAMTH